MILTLLLASLLSQATEECPAFLELKVPSLDRPGQQAAQRYADCMRVPHLPLADALSDKAKRCAIGRSAKAATKKATDWVTHIATNLAGCETRLTIIRK